MTLFSVNLLETILFNADTCESLDDFALDLVDYCYRTISFLLSLKQNYSITEVKNVSDVYDNFLYTTILEYGMVSVNYSLIYKSSRKLKLFYGIQ